jgi:hypothetical protein
MTSRATRLETAFSRLSPFSWVSTEGATSSGGKATGFLDLVLSGHVMAQSSGALQVNDPAPVSVLNNALAATFTAAQLYQSNLPAADWAFLHNGAGFHVLIPFYLTSTAAGVLLATRASGDGFQHYAVTNQLYTYAAPAMTSVRILASPSALANTAILASSSYVEGASPEISIRSNGVSANVASDNAPSAASPQGSLTLGANPPEGGSGVKVAAHIPEFAVFKRALTASELSIAQSYYSYRYGTAAL